MSLRYRITVVIFLLEAVMMSFILSVTVNKSQEISKQQLHTNEVIILNLLSDLSRVALFSHEYQELQPYIENISKDPHVLKIQILNRDSLVMTSSDVADVGRHKNLFEKSNESYWKIHQIKNASGNLGKIAIQFSNSELRDAKQETLLTGIKIALIGMSLIAVAGFVTGNLLTRRLSVLTRAAQNIKSGNLDVRSNLIGHDEISVLGQTLDDMTSSFGKTVKKLTTRESELENVRNELEDRVSERTEELSIANAELEHLATHDHLTGLPNRSLLLVRLQQAITLCLQIDTSFAVLMLDLDRFKEVNDTLGHDVGDSLLIQVSQQFKEILRKGDTIARLGGDEFCILLPNVTAQDAEEVSKKIANTLKTTDSIHFQDIKIGVSIGITLFPDHSTETLQLMKYADVAMYQAKRTGLDYYTYDEVSNDSNIITMSREQALISAIENNELLLHYQPKVDITSGQLVGVEALVRWQSHGTLIYPDEFIPYAEKTGTIKRLTSWVLNAAIQQLSIWNAMGKELKMSVNISAVDLGDPIFSSDIAKYLDTWHVDPNHLILEITETGVMTDPNKARKILDKIDELGIEISIDDFGTGYSSLVYLKKLPVNELKIDRSFINDIIMNADSMVIVRSIIDLAHNLGIIVTAEGVENREVWDLLSIMGCDIAQGYYLGKPMTSADFENCTLYEKNLMNFKTQASAS